ncbi:calcium-dependent protein kinase 6-like isoform X2 [Physella acuta]|uniref:calcium-dependent protein kinase 6-like isoform X2 n=1 Tax=Physella acuta TaxID=109671 RepID=UPI0027DB2B0B|nr:calcium-dependent protein kinase 6-like isoform X2 [Physella acuta]
MPHNYVDNPMNRRLGRVGLPRGSAVHSAGSSTSSRSNYYVDNSLNRSLGRVGLPHGTAVHSSSSSSSSSYKTYVDNPLNQSLGRVGMPHGTAVHSRSDNSLTYRLQQLTTSDHSKVYKDNKLNRKLGRVGMPLGSMPQSSQSARATTPKTTSSHSASSSGKVYVDNYYNRKHNRVGKPLGSVPIPANTQKYKDTPLNRSLGRVGKPWGTCPNKKWPHADLLQKLMYMQEGEDFPDEIEEIYETNEVAEDFINHFMDLVNREKTIRGWLEQKGTGWKAQSHLSLQTIEKYKGNVIPFEELELKKKIGHGGFGDVHLAEWKGGEAVAVKKLRVERVSQKRRQQFEDEIALFCTLQHPNIVGFLGACVVSPNLAIVMEYMDMSLYEALHVKQVDFADHDKLNIMRNVSQGIDYLHEKSIAHCDLKTQNVLLNNVPGQDLTDSQEVVIAKITDFGLSMMKNDMESSASAGTAVSNIGTPRYSAPEVLRGELLNVEQLMKADVYSEGLLILELVVEEIAFEDLTIQQLRVQVGEKNLKPDIPRRLTLDKQLKKMLEKCWSSKPDDRPSSHSVCLMVNTINNLIIGEERSE